MITVLSTDVLPQLRMNVDDYLSADLPEGYRYELVEGVVRVAPIPDVTHNCVVQAACKLFVLYRDSNRNIISHMSQRCAITLAHRNIVRDPDFAVYSVADSPRDPGKTWKNTTPLLVLEVVSHGQETIDYEEKRQDYWDAGVGEYWIADPQRSMLTVLTRGPSGWVEQVFDSSKTYRPPSFPGLEVRIAELFE